MDSQIHDLAYFAYWANYAAHVDITKPELEDLVVIENPKWDTRVLLGYDSKSNSIITSFRGTSTTLNWLEDFVFFKNPYIR